MSFVARGRAWNPTAYPPTIRYRTRCTFKDAMNSAKSGNIKLALHSKAVQHALADQRHALVSGHRTPWIEGLALVEAGHGDGPVAADAVLYLAHAVVRVSRCFPRHGANRRVARGSADAILVFAHRRGKQDAVKERFLRAYLTDGELMSDPETLVRLAGEAGLDPEEVRATRSDR